MYDMNGVEVVRCVLFLLFVLWIFYASTCPRPRKKKLNYSRKHLFTMLEWRFSLRFNSIVRIFPCLIRRRNFCLDGMAANTHTKKKTRVRKESYCTAQLRLRIFFSGLSKYHLYSIYLQTTHFPLPSFQCFCKNKYTN